MQSHTLYDIETWGRTDHPWNSGMPEVQIQWNPHRRNSMGRKPTEPLVDPRDLIEEEVAMRNYPLKSRK